MLAYTEKESADSELLLETLIDQAHRLADSFGKQSNPQHRFEQFLGALNETLSEHVREGRWSVPINSLHAVVGIASENQMFLSGTGELTAMFLHKKPSQRYQVYNLFRGIQTEQALPTWEKPFAVVLDGDLHPGDVFVICDKNLQQTIEQDELNGILSTLPPVSAVEKIRQYFSHKKSILLLILKKESDSTQSHPGTESSSATPRASVSVEQLRGTEQETDRFLEDQRPNLTASVKKIVSWFKSKTTNKSRILEDLNTEQSFMTSLKRFLRTLTKILLFVVKRLHKQTKRLIVIVKKKETREQIKKGLLTKEGLSSKAKRILHPAQAVPRSTKFLIGGIIIAIIVLTVGVSTIMKSQARSSELEAYQNELTTIEETIERAAGSVIYKDEDQARTFYINAQTLLESLPVDTPERAQKSAELTIDIQTALDDIRHLVNIPNPPLIADLSVVTDGVFGTALTQTTQQLYVLASDARAYTLNSQEKRFDVAADAPSSQSVAKAASQEDDRIYYMDTLGEVYALTTAGLESSSIANTSWVDLEAYADRLYILQPSSETTEGQVVRFNRNGSAFQGETNWITSRTVSFDQATSLAIDGSVYILMKNGSISRFTSGTEDGYSLGTVEPRMTNATKIWTDPDSDFLYVIEPDTKRLVIYNKETGELVRQYTSDAFVDLRDFIVDESDYTIYLLAGSKLFSIAASHIN